MKVEYSLLLIKKIYFEDFYVSKLKVKMWISLQTKSFKKWNTFYQIFLLFDTIWTSTKIKNKWFDFFRLGKVKIYFSRAFLRFWTIIACFLFNFLTVKSLKNEIHLFQCFVVWKKLKRREFDIFPSNSSKNMNLIFLASEKWKRSTNMDFTFKTEKERKAKKYELNSCWLGKAKKN